MAGAPFEHVVDALGRIVAVSPAVRVVSLVPSETESVCRLAGVGRVVGRTDYCIEPRADLERVASVGGTKSVDRAAVIGLRPDLVLANQEENTRSDVEALLAAGLRVHVSFPRTLSESAAYVSTLARLLGVPDHPLVIEARAAVDAARCVVPTHVHRVLVPIWRDPWMGFDERTFASDVLAHAGLANVLEGRPRRYPLAADLGHEAPREVAGRDTRYPRFSLEEARARAPEVVLLPDEPYAFGEADAGDLRAALGAHTRVVFVDGKDLFWYGVRAIGAPARLRARIDAEPPGAASRRA